MPAPPGPTPHDGASHDLPCLINALDWVRVAVRLPHNGPAQMRSAI